MKLVKIEECFGNKGCPNSLGDTKYLVEKLNEIIEEEKLEDFIKEKCGEKVLLHNTFRIGISNCPNACSQVHIKDFGLIQRGKLNFDKNSCVLCRECVKVCLERALKIENNELNINYEKCIGCGSCIKVCESNALSFSKKGFKIVAGGKLGRHPMLALEVKDFVENKDTIIEIFKKIIKFYKENNLHGERLGSIIQRVGINEFFNKLKGG